jgi:hypothetical protein
MRMIVDIDTALTVRAPSGRRHSLPECIEKVKGLLAEGHGIVLWSARGLRYARRFAKDNALDGCRTIVKPDQIIARF